MKNNKRLLIALLLGAGGKLVYAQNENVRPILNIIEWIINDTVRILLCLIWGITGAILALVVILAGLNYLKADESTERTKAKRRIINAGIGLIILVLACPVVNYLVSDSKIKEFKCSCISPTPRPTTTTTTTTTLRTTTTTTTKRTTTTRTTTTIKGTTTTLFIKTSGGRFLMVGNNKFYTYDMDPYKPDDLAAVIFNLDGSIYRNPFMLDNDPGPVALAVGKNRFFIAYGQKATVLDWDGGYIKAKFETLKDYFPVKAVHVEERFYLLLSPSQGSSGAVIQVYDLQGNMLKTFNTGIDKIAKATEHNWGASMLCEDKQKEPGVHVTIPEGDMAYGNGKLFIVWWSEADKKVYGQLYDRNGGKVKDKFAIKDVPEANCTRQMNVASKTPDDPAPIQCKWVTLTYNYVNPQIAAGSKNFMVMMDGELYLYDLNTLKLNGQKTFVIGGNETLGTLNSTCVDDIAYGDGDGKYMAVKGNSAKFFDEDGNEAGTAEFGGHDDQLTQLAYGNKMYVGVVAIHMNGDGIGASFIDSGGKHIVDVVPLEMSESPGWAAYDW